MKMFNVLQPIRPYVAPLWTVEPYGDEIRGNDVDDELCYEVTIEEDHVTGWFDSDDDQYVKIISMADDYGETRFYLAGWRDRP